MDVHEANTRPNVNRKRRPPVPGAAVIATPAASPVESSVENAQEEIRDARPALKLLFGPAGSGKTEWALQRLETCWRAGQRGLLIVSSPQQAQTRAEQLAARLDIPVEETLPCMVTFRQLAARLIEEEVEENSEDEDAAPAVGAIGRAFQRLAIAELLPATIRPDDFLGRMLRAPGFVPAFAERVREWKLAGLTPDLLEQSGPLLAVPLSDPTFARKTQELARLFRAYEAFLTRNQLRDDEDCLRLAVERVNGGASGLPPQTACVVVDGFYRFNAMQRRLLVALSGHVPGTNAPPIEVAVTLPYESRRPLLFAAPARTLTLLRQEFACHETPLTFTPPTRPPALALLSDSLFEEYGEEKEKRRKGEKEEIRDTRYETQEKGKEELLSTLHSPLSTDVQLFDAPNPYVEAEMVARAFRRLYDTGRYAWSDFAVILRAMGDYAPILAAVFERHDIPLGIDGPETLTENPFLKTLLHLLNIVRRGWQRDDVLAFLKSSYTAPDKIEADALRRRARQSGIREGREKWLKLVEGTGNREQGKGKIQDTRYEIREEEDSSLIPHPSSLNVCLLDLAHYDALLTRERQDPRHFALLIEEIVGHFGLQERIAQGEPTRQQRDRTAWQTAKDVLQALAKMAALSGRDTLTFPGFHDELLAAWQASSSIATAEGDRVRVAEPYDARERPLKVAAVMGLTERVFPRRITEDPFLRDAERIALRQVTGMDLEEQRGRADDERFFFYLAVTAPAERLILSYPRSADESDTLPSFYLDEVKSVFRCSGVQVFGNSGAQNENVSEAVSEHPNTRTPEHLMVVSRTLADVAPRPDEVVSHGDRLLAACATLFDPGVGQMEGGTLRQAVQLMQMCMREEADRRVAQRVVEARGLPRLPRLDADGLRRAFATNRAVFSVTELESYGRCPFQYFLRHVLRLRPEPDGIASNAQGTLLHAVLHRYFAGKREEGRGKREENSTPNTQHPTPNTRETLHLILSEMLAQESLDAGPHQKQMTHRLLADALDGFASREERFQTQFGMQPAHFELTFGVGTRRDWEDEEERQIGQSEEAAGESSASAWHYDPASCAEPLLLNVVDGGPPVAICGTLDRVDYDSTGTRALVLDYKLGRPPTFGEFSGGKVCRCRCICWRWSACSTKWARWPATTARRSGGGVAFIVPSMSARGSSRPSRPSKMEPVSHRSIAPNTRIC